MTELLDPELQLAIEQLQSPDAAVRRVAVMNIAELAEPDGLVFLTQALSDTDTDVRVEAAQALAGWDETIAVTALTQGLFDAEQVVRESAADSLSQIKEAQLAPVLIAALSELDQPAASNAFVKASLLRALRELRAEQSAPLALAALADTDASVRREAIAVLGWLKWAPALDFISERLAQDEDTEVRRAAAGALGFGQGLTVLHSLRVALADSAWQVREEAASTLAKVLLQTPDQSAHIEQLGQALTASLADEYWQVRLRAARSLGRIKFADALQPLIELLQHSISNLRKEAALALGELADRQALAALHLAESDPDPEVRKAVRIALAQIAPS